MNRSIEFNWKLCVFSVVFFVLFIRLGFWQLDRGVEKEALIITEQQRLNQAPVEFRDLPEDVLALSSLPVQLTGGFLTDRFFLLDNRVLNGKVGFEVLVPFREQGGQLVLVNRGFVQMGRRRDGLPQIPELTELADVSGRIYVGSLNKFAPDELSGSTRKWPRIVQTSDPAVLQQFIGEPFYPYVVRLKLGDSNALPRFWPVTLISPAKHHGYALQWFTMALTILIAFLYFTFRNRDD